MTTALILLLLLAAVASLVTWARHDGLVGDSGLRAERVADRAAAHRTRRPSRTELAESAAPERRAPRASRPARQPGGGTGTPRHPALLAR